jgi:hypothetical protein
MKNREDDPFPENFEIEIKFKLTCPIEDRPL